MAKLETKIYDARISDLTETEHNPRQISKKDFAKLKKSLKEFPEMLDIREVVIDENNVILGGHQRVKAALANGDETIPVKQVFGLTDEQKRQFVIKDNIANGDWDMDEIANAWSDIPFDDWGLDVDWAEPKEIVEDAAPEVNESEPAKSELGKVYQLGQHRLMCGDSTDAGSVAILMDGQKADMVLTDPPYGIDIVGGGKSFGKVGGGKIVESKTYSKIIGDDTTETARKNYEIVRDFSDNQVIFGGNYFTDFLKPSKCWCVWDKQNTGNFADVELAWTSFDKGARIYHYMWNGLVREGSRDLELTARVHPTQKPVGMLMCIIRDFTTDKTSILDCFGGSGSTLIACEQLGRKCYMMELDPKYCDVIRKRYWEFVNGSKDGWEESTPEVERG